MRKVSFLGLALVVIGGLWLMDSLGVLPGGNVWVYIPPILLMGIGVQSFVNARRVSIWGTLLTLGGLYWLLVNLRLLEAASFGMIAAVVLILLGVVVLINGVMRPRAMPTRGMIADVAIFGGSDQNFVGETFEGVSLTAIFGGSKLDVTGYSAYPPAAACDVFTVFGGSTLIIPPCMRIERRGLVCLFGGMSVKGAPSESAAGVLDVSGLVLFGGLDIVYQAPAYNGTKSEPIDDRDEEIQA